MDPLLFLFLFLFAYHPSEIDAISERAFSIWSQNNLFALPRRCHLRSDVKTLFGREPTVWKLNFDDSSP
jgi:hypothetical protein